MLQKLLGFLLIVPETGRGNPVFELLKLGAFRLWVKETSATRPLVVSSSRTFRVILGRQSHQAFVKISCPKLSSVLDCLAYHKVLSMWRERELLMTSTALKDRFNRPVRTFTTDKEI